MVTFLCYTINMRPEKEEALLKDHAEVLFNSLAFWETKISELLEKEDWTDEFDVFDVEEDQQQELHYLYGKLQFDMREMERLDKKFRKFKIRRDKGD